MRHDLFAAAWLALVLAPLASAAASGGGLVGEWRVVSISGVESLESHNTTFALNNAGRFATSIGCNRMVGTPEINGAQITFGGLAATRMACPPPLDEIERKYQQALEAVRSSRISNDKAELLDASGAVMIALRKAG